jgi:hypothetical protein
MLNKRRTALILSGLVGFALGYCFRIAFEGSKFVLAEWEQEPIVVVCPDSALTPHRVATAIEWWKNKNFKISSFHFDQTNAICGRSRFMEGIIFVRSKGYIDPEFYATTRRLAVGTNLLSADINLPNSNKNMPRLLEHELGHALGLGHVEVLGHMMHPIHSHGGEKFWIPD